jgi:hypothetical protein
MTLPPLYRGHNPALQMDKVELSPHRYSPACPPWCPPVVVCPENPDGACSVLRVG